LFLVGRFPKRLTNSETKRKNFLLDFFRIVTSFSTGFDMFSKNTTKEGWQKSKEN